MASALMRNISTATLLKKLLKVCDRRCIQMHIYLAPFDRRLHTDGYHYSKPHTCA
jgi:hypothetical protein